MIRKIIQLRGGFLPSGDKSFVGVPGVQRAW